MTSAPHLRGIIHTVLASRKTFHNIPELKEVSYDEGTRINKKMLFLLKKLVEGEDGSRHLIIEEICKGVRRRKSREEDEEMKGSTKRRKMAKEAIEHEEEIMNEGIKIEEEEVELDEDGAEHKEDVEFEEEEVELDEEQGLDKDEVGLDDENVKPTKREVGLDPEYEEEIMNGEVVVDEEQVSHEGRVWPERRI